MDYIDRLEMRGNKICINSFKNNSNKPVLHVNLDDIFLMKKQLCLKTDKQKFSKWHCLTFSQIFLISGLIEDSSCFISASAFNMLQYHIAM